MDKETKDAFKKTNESIENLASAVKHGFDAVDKRFEKLETKVDEGFEQVDRRFEKVENNLSHMNMRMLTMERDIAEIRAHFVYREEFEDMMARLKYVEKKLNIESGK